MPRSGWRKQGSRKLAAQIIAEKHTSVGTEIRSTRSNRLVGRRQEESYGGSPVGWGFHYRRVHLCTWPDFIGMPAEQLPVVARICALVNRRPTVASLIPLILDLPKAEVFTALEYLQANAHVHMPAYDATQAASLPATDETLSSPAELTPDDMPLAPPSLITRLWSRLSAISRR